MKIQITNHSPRVQSCLPSSSVINTGIHVFLLLLSSVGCFWGHFEHSLTKSVRFESGLRDLLLQHIPHILQSSSGFWADQQSFRSDLGNRCSLGTVGCTQHPTFWLTTHDTAMLHSGHCDFPVFRSILRSLGAFTKHLYLMWDSNALWQFLWHQIERHC